jgi:hypothetical protein
MDEGGSINKDVLHFDDGRDRFRSKQVPFTFDSGGNTSILNLKSVLFKDEKSNLSTCIVLFSIM